MNKPKSYIIHHSLTDDGPVLESFSAIKRNHMAKGWSDIGYHWVLEMVNNKLVWFKGRAESTNGAHCKEQGMNSKSIGICVVGNFDKYPPTPAHYMMLAEKIAELDAKYGQLPIEPHHLYAAYKSCPGNQFDMFRLVSMCRLAPIKEHYQSIIQEHCEFSAPELVWKLMDTHPFSLDLYKKWAESYNVVKE